MSKDKEKVIYSTNPVNDEMVDALCDKIDEVFERLILSHELRTQELKDFMAKEIEKYSNK